MATRKLAAEANAGCCGAGILHFTETVSGTTQNKSSALFPINASAVSDAPHSKGAGRFGKSAGDIHPSAYGSEPLALVTNWTAELMK
jgi:hypothetical protein